MSQSRSSPRGPSWRRRLRLTRDGWYYFFVTIGVGLAAINTGNNLLYLVLGLLLSLIVVSGILSEGSLRGIEVLRRLPPRAEAGLAFSVEIVLRNTKPTRRTYSVEIEDLLEDRSAGKRCYFLKVGAGASQTATYRMVLPRRGLHRYLGVRVSTRFPFGLFEKSRDLDLAAELLVYPARIPVPSFSPPRDPGIGDDHSRRAGRGSEYFALRDFVSGDDPRSIHWRTSARTDRLLVREREDEARPGVRLLLDNTLTAPSDPEAREAVEQGIRLAASLAIDLVRRGMKVALETSSGASARAATPRELDGPLTCLALLPIVAADAAAKPSGLVADVAIAHRGAAPPRARRVLWVGA